jgi:hypothetical protein
MQDASLFVGPDHAYRVFLYGNRMAKLPNGSVSRTDSLGGTMRIDVLDDIVVHHYDLAECQNRGIIA